MNRQRLKRYVAILAAGLWALLLSVCQVQAQDKKDAPTTPPGKDAPMQDKKEAPTTPPAKDPQSKDKKDAQAQDKKDDVAKSVRKEKIRIARRIRTTMTTNITRTSRGSCISCRKIA